MTDQTNEDVESIADGDEIPPSEEVITQDTEPYFPDDDVSSEG